MRKFQSGSDRLIVIAREQAARRGLRIMIIGPFVLVGILVVAVGVIGLTQRRTPAPRPALTGTEACLTYELDTMAGNTGAIDAFEQAQGLTEQQTANLARECANYECEPLAEAAAAVRSPNWSGLPDPAKQRYAAPCG